MPFQCDFDRFKDLIGSFHPVDLLEHTFFSVVLHERRGLRVEDLEASSYGIDRIICAAFDFGPLEQSLHQSFFIGYQVEY